MNLLVLLAENVEFTRQALSIAFIILAIALILFVLFRQTDSTGLAAAFGGGGGGGEGAFGAKTQKVADKVIAWMCGLFMVVALLIAYVSTTHISDVNAANDDKSNATDSDTTK